MPAAGKWIGSCSLAVLIALYVVGAVSHGSLRHVVQTLPLWFPIVAGFAQRGSAKWAALPCFAFWLPVMILIWLFLLGRSHIIEGHFSPTEVAMTVVIGVACIVGIGIALRWRAGVRPIAAAAVVTIFGILQLLAFRLSLIPFIATR